MISLLLALTLAAADDPPPTPTPYPQQDPAEAVATPPPESEPEPEPVAAATPAPSKYYPGNYYWLPLSLDAGWRPCMDCDAKFDIDHPYRRPGEMSVWAGYAFVPDDRESTPFLAGGVEWVFATNNDAWDTRGRHLVIPTWRMGMHFDALASVYGTAGIILPVGYSYGWGWHLGVGLTSPVTLLCSAVLTGGAVPSVVEAAWENFPLERGGRPQQRFVLKVGWGF